MLHFSWTGFEKAPLEYYISYLLTYIEREKEEILHYKMLSRQGRHYCNILSLGGHSALKAQNSANGNPGS